MTSYRIERFWGALTLDADEEIVGTNLSPKPNAQNMALVKEAEEEGQYYCGVETGAGECGREVNSPDDVCWQHSED